MRTPLLVAAGPRGLPWASTETMCNETTRGLETPARQEVSTVPVGSGTRTGPSESRPRRAVSVGPEPGGTSRTTLMPGSVFGSGMASTSQLKESDVPWKTAPEYAREAARALGYPTNGRVWMTAVQYATKHGLNSASGQQPSTVGAAAVYLCGLLFNDKRSQLQVADATGVSPVTLRNAYQKIARAEGFRV